MPQNSQPNSAGVYEQRRFYFLFWTLLVLIGTGGSFWLASALRMQPLVFGLLGSALVIALALFGIREAREGSPNERPEDSAVMRLVARADGGKLAPQRGSRPLALRGADGNVLLVKKPSLIGRAPQPTPGHEAIALPDCRSMSKSHARLEPDAGRIIVTDLGSTNGTRAATTAEAPLTLLSPDDSHSIEPGGRLVFGNQQFQVIERR